MKIRRDVRISNSDLFDFVVAIEQAFPYDAPHIEPAQLKPFITLAVKYSVGLGRDAKEQAGMIARAMLTGGGDGV